VRVPVCRWDVLAEIKNNRTLKERKKESFDVSRGKTGKRQGSYPQSGSGDRRSDRPPIVKWREIPMEFWAGKGVVQVSGGPFER